MIKYELTDELKQDLANGDLVVNNTKLANNKENLVIELENKNDNGNLMRCQIANFEVITNNNEDNPSINGAEVTDLVVGSHYNSYGNTYFVIVAISLEQEGKEFTIISHE